jgi:hypothetical protein
LAGTSVNAVGCKYKLRELVGACLPFVHFSKTSTACEHCQHYHIKSSRRALTDALLLGVDGLRIDRPAHKVGGHGDGEV